MPPVRNVTVEESDEVYRLLDMALFAANGLRVQRHQTVIFSAVFARAAWKA
jgi:hypothetical protein